MTFECSALNGISESSPSRSREYHRRRAGKEHRSSSSNGEEGPETLSYEHGMNS